MVIKKKKTTLTSDKKALRKKVEVIDKYSEIDSIVDVDLSKKFDLKSEKIERDVYLDTLSEEEKNAPDTTTIQVYKEGSVEQIKASDLKNFIKKSKGIQQIVIEKISIDQATRVAMKYVPKSGDGGEEDNHESNHVKKFLDQTTPTHNNQKAKSKSSKSSVVLIKDNEEIKVKKKAKNFTLKSRKVKKTKDLKKVRYEKHQLTKKNNLVNEYFYKAKDHVELFKVGNSYLLDFEKGLNSFAFICLDDVSSGDREKSSFGVCTFFAHHKDISICIVTSSIFNSFYAPLVDIECYTEQEIFENDKIKVFNGDGFDVITFDELAYLSSNIGTFNLSHVVEFIVDKYDLVLWDLPSVEHMNKNKQIFFPIIRSIDSVSIVVSENKTQIQDIADLVNYFKKYEVKVKGFLFSSSKEIDREAA